MAVKITPSSGNVFVDLGFPAEEAQNLMARSRLMAEIKQIIQDRGLTQTEAAELFGVTQPRISDLTRGEIQKFSVDGLMAMLARADMEVHVSVKPGKKVA